MSDLHHKLLLALITKGPIHAEGGGVYDAENNYLMTTTEFQPLANEMGLQRTDSGGSPTWVRP